MEAISEAALRLFDRWLTDAMGTRPDAHRSRGGRTRTRMRRSKTPARRPRQLQLAYRSAKRTRSLLFAALSLP